MPNVYDPETKEQSGGLWNPGPGHDEASGDSSDPRGEGQDRLNPSQIRNAEETPDKPSDDKNSSLGGAEKAAASSSQDGEENDEKLGKGYTGSGKSRRKIRITRRRAIMGGGAGILIGLVMGSGSIVQGPLEVVHFAQLLNKFHFLSQQDAQDVRVTRIVRYLKEPSKPQNTRLGKVGNIIADSYTKTMREKTGLSPAYDKLTGTFLGYEIDRNHERYKDLKTNQIKDKVGNKYGGQSKDVYVESNTSDGKQLLVYDPERNIRSIRNPIQAYRAQIRAYKAILVDAGYSKKSALVGARVLAVRGGITFHPIRKLDAAIQASALKQGKKGVDKLKEQYKKQRVGYVSKGVTALEVKPRDDSARDEKGNPTNATDTERAASATAESGDIGQDATTASSEYAEGKDGSKALKEKLTGRAGKAAGVAGLLCIAQGLNDYVDQSKQAKAIEPMMRMGGDVLSNASQYQSGDDMTMIQAGFLKDFLTEKENGKVISTWNQAESIQAESGKQNTGKPIPESGNVFSTGGAIPLASSLPIAGFCKALSSPIGVFVGFVTAPASSVVQAATMPKLIELVGGWLSGAPVNPLAAGADFGSFANYGAKLTAGDQSASTGGVSISQSDARVVKNISNELDQKSFDKQSIAQRLFNINDSRSLAASLYDNNYQYLGINGALNLGQHAGSLFSSMFKAPLSMFSSLTSAAESQTFDYSGAKNIGFSAEDLGNPDYDDPFKNACQVVGCTDSNITGILEDPSKAEEYTDRAEKCFGAKISNDGTSWNIDRNTKSVAMYSKDYPDSDCRSRSSEWMKIRFWILDTATIEGLDCYLGDTETSSVSCVNSGFTRGDVSTASSENADDSAALTADAKELAQKILDSDKITLGGNPKSSIEAAAQGKKSPAGVDQCGVQHDPVAIDQKILAFLFDLSGKDSFTVNSLATGEHSCTSNHYKGAAVDLACDLDTAKADQVGKKYGITHNFENCANNAHWHYSIGGS